MDFLNLLKQELDNCVSLDDKVTKINEIRSALNVLSPFKEPTDFVRWVKNDTVQANDYNPNVVASTEMKLLYESIKSDGYTQPIVVYPLGDGRYEIVDGYHRHRVGKEYKDIKEKIHGYLPVVVVDKPVDERIGSTIRHNRARGSHQIKSMSDIVLDLLERGWDDEKISVKLGMDREEILRLKQISGLKQAFANHVFSKSWEEFEKNNFPEEQGKTKTIANKPKRNQ